MAEKHTKAGKRGKRVKDLRAKATTSRQAGRVKGGKPGGTIELHDFSFGVENPTNIGSGAGGSGAGKISFGELNIKKP